VFWSLFLPLGTRWSVDAVVGSSGSGGADSVARDGVFPGSECVVGIATAALLVQVVTVYTINAALKLRSDRWLTGDAVRYVFSLDQFTVLFGDALAGYPDLLTAASHVWLALVCGSVLLLLLTGWPRVALVGAFASVHAGMLLTMMLGLFPLISIAALLPFLPSRVWDRVDAFLGPLGDRFAAAAVRSPLGRSPVVPPVPGGLRRWTGRVVSVVVAVLLVAMLVWNAATLGAVDPPDALGDPGLSDQHWRMFAPNPLGTDGWYVAPARTVSGERVDAYNGGTVSFDRPPDIAATYRTARWRKYLTNLRSWSALQPAFAEYLCTRWNASHDDDIVSVTAYFIAQPTRLDGPEPTRRNTVVEHDCGSRRNL